MRKVVVVVENHSMSDADRKVTICFFCRHQNEAHLLFCQDCNKILAASTNFFSKFGYPITFDIDLADCKNRYIDMQSKVHPDLFVKKSEIEQTLALNVSSYLNVAYNILQDPLSRSKYILSLYNIDVDLNAQKHFTESPDFLDEIMDLNELQSKINNDEDQVIFAQEISGKISALLLNIANDFKEKNYNQAAIDTIKLKYYQRASNTYHN